MKLEEAIKHAEEVAEEKEKKAKIWLDEFSEKYDWRKPNYFYIDNIGFKVSHVRRLVEREG